MEQKVGSYRKVTALVALGASLLATVFLAYEEIRFSGDSVAWIIFQQFAVLGAFLASALYGVARDRVWGRWAGLAVGLIALWRMSSQIFMALFYAHWFNMYWDWEHVFMAAVGLLLTGSLLGRVMYARYEGRVFGELPTRRWDRFTLLVVRWSAIVAITMLPFIVSSVIYGTCEQGSFLPVWLYRPTLVILGAAVFSGIVLIARQKTAGVLLIAFAGSVAAWIFGGVMNHYGDVNLFEATCRAGHSLVYLLPALVLAAPMFRLLTGRGR